MVQYFDVIVVGARCAGATLAIRLGNAGHRVLLLDQGNFPSDTLSTHAIFNNTVWELKDLGIFPLIPELDAPPVRNVLLQFEDVKIEGSLPPIKGEEDSYCIRRSYLDQAAIQKASEIPNVTIYTKVRVKDLLWDEDRVVGVKTKDALGQQQEYHSKWVVGADGRNSTVRKKLKLKPLIDVPTDFACYFTYIEGLEAKSEPTFEVYRIYDRTLVIFPTNHHQHVVFVAFPLANRLWIKEFGHNSKSALWDFLKTQFVEIKFNNRLHNAKIVEKIRGLTGFSNHWFSGIGKGWALVGDAVIFKDPALAQGIHDAIYAGKILQPILEKAMQTDEIDETQLDRLYQEQLQAKFRERFELGIALTKNNLMSAEQKLFQQTISQYPEAVEKFLGFYNYANNMDAVTQIVRSIIEQAQIK
ncbi:NAD(P)/FAD-dependent oxidoreductase [Risungbinella massiliensis]|uniref:NAD(P)/FAD-dependent oxidoreductase n=1 Tax=Risungbinella massiliensis TaxID=1329796 RepID=UPI0005CBE820|nr:NAD(P)/FAD-dependent oxidoreductase [Risungbinella massiliensis]